MHEKPSPFVIYENTGTVSLVWSPGIFSGKKSVNIAGIARTSGVLRFCARIATSAHDRNHGKNAYYNSRTYTQSTTQSTSMATMPDPALERCSSCFFPTEFHDVPLVAVKEYNHDTKIFTFGLPAGVSLDLPVCSCILVKGTNADGEPAIRPYTPTSSNEQKDSFDLMVKVFRLFLSVCVCKHAFGTQSAVAHVCIHQCMAMRVWRHSALSATNSMSIICIRMCVHTHTHTHTHIHTHKQTHTHTHTNSNPRKRPHSIYIGLRAGRCFAVAELAPDWCDGWLQAHFDEHPGTVSL